ncbi:MAG TPA: hypothetical protein DG942_03370 [Ruminococcaceae bacterium]|jgi:diguanylate cyclase (GGDEF)-like protein|nr:hypothetical protein [Oscillospiraceae bacterium]
MKMTLVPEFYGADSLLYNMYRNLPIGAVMLDFGLMIISSNRKFKEYFPCIPHGPNGLPFCKAIGCLKDTGNSKSERPKKCRKCDLLKNVTCMMQNNRQMQTVEIKSTLLCQCSKEIKWFKIDGFPVRYAGQKCAVLFFNDITDHVQKEKQLKEKLKIDMPTQVFNKYSVIQDLDAILKTEKQKSFSLCMIDFDNFKKINDTYGHLMGDKILCKFSEIARRNIRMDDIVGRFGGEEFIFIFCHTDLAQASGAISRIQCELAKSFRGEVISPVTFSAGIIYYEENANVKTKWKSLMEAADRLLYQAKAQGKNQIVTSVWDCKNKKC